ncbi:MAG: endoglucanase [Myxococcales bacterium]|nr:MAG: endoglucanase [Myxococcales bacterium]
MTIARSRRFVSFVTSLGMGALVACGGCSGGDSGPLVPSGGQATSGSAGTPSAGSGGSSGTSFGGAGGGSSGNATTGGASGGAGGGGAGVGSGGAGAGGTGGAGGNGGAGASGGGGGVAGFAGAAGASGSGGMGGAAAYNPCPTNGDPCKLMPLGDSITDGVGSSADKPSYRYELFRLALMAQKKLTFVGSGQNGPQMVDGSPFPRNHEGHSGWTIDDGGGREGLYPKIEGWLNATSPHIVTLMIGTNDVNIELDLPNASKRLGLLIDRITATVPNALVVVAKIVPTTNDGKNQRVMAYNDAIPALVKARADVGKHVTSVDMYGAFTKNASYKSEYMNDELHPKDAGYTVMANTWYPVIGSLLPAK